MELHVCAIVTRYNDERVAAAPDNDAIWVKHRRSDHVVEKCEAFASANRALPHDLGFFVKPLFDLPTLLLREFFHVRSLRQIPPIVESFSACCYQPTIV